MIKINLDKNLINKIKDYMFYDKETMKKFEEEWKKNMETTNCFLFNAFNDQRCSYYKFYDLPCWYCKSQNRRSANSHSVFECIRYHRDLDKFSCKFRKKN